jgi:hypothetical protein
MRVKEHSIDPRLFNLDESKKATKPTLALSQDYSTWMRVHIHSLYPKTIDSDESKKATKPTHNLSDQISITHESNKALQYMPSPKLTTQIDSSEE